MTRIEGNSTLPTSNVTVLQSVDQIAVQLGGDPQAYLAAMVLKFAGERREDAQQMRNSTETRIQQMEQRQVQELRDQADKILTAGALSAIGGIVGGGLNIAGGSALMDGKEGLSMKYEGGGKVSEAVGNGGGTVFNGFAKEDEAESIEAANRAAAAIRQLDSVEDDIDSANNLENAALDFLEQANKTQAETAQSLYIRG